MSPFYSFGIEKYARFVEWGVQILRGHNFLNEFGDTQFFSRFDILIWSATLPKWKNFQIGIIFTKAPND